MQSDTTQLVAESAAYLNNMQQHLHTSLRMFDNALIHYRERAPRVTSRSRETTYYTLYHNEWYTYCASRAEAEQHFQQVKTHFEKELRSFKPSQYTADAELLDFVQQQYRIFQQYGIQEHFGNVEHYTIDGVIGAEGYPEVEQRIETIDPQRVMELLEWSYSELQEQEVQEFRFTGIAYQDHQEFDHQHIYFSAPFQQVYQRYAEEIQSGHYTSFLAVLAEKAGVPARDMQHAVTSLTTWLDDLTLYLTQYAVRLWYMHWQRDVASLHQDDTPRIWEESLMDYERMVETLMHHARYVQRLFDTHRIRIVSRRDGLLYYTVQDKNTVPNSDRAPHIWTHDDAVKSAQNRHPLKHALYRGY